MQEKFRQAEDLGYDVLTVSDYVTVNTVPPLSRPGTSMPPFLALLLAAEVTTRPRLGTYSINAGIYPAALLIRDVAAFQNITDGRLELGLGAGYLKADYAAVEVPWGRAADRIGRVDRMVSNLRDALDPLPPLLIGSATSYELLALAAEQADIVSINGAESKTQFSRARLVSSLRLAERLDFLKVAAGARLPDIEVNTLVHAVNVDDQRGPVPSFPNVEDLPADELAKLPGILSGSPRTIAEDLLRYRDTYGISYYTIREAHLEPFARVIDELRTQGQ
jgi:probable F420-dependent oxidoreductase